MSNLKPADYGKMFIEYAKPVDGVTEWVTFEELEKHFGVTFKTTNGSWAQKDRGPLQEYVLLKHPPKGRVLSIKLDGYKDKSKERATRQDILNSIKKQRCRVVDAGGNKIECDHKDGRYTLETYGDIKNQQEDDFQPLHETCNKTKREWCKKCEASNKRYDARRLGYSAGWIVGDENYLGTCFGCYWYDPRKFNQIISRDFKKEDG